MNKKLKLITIVAISSFMLLTWALIFFSHTVATTTNYIWQIGMGLSGLTFAIFGILTAKKWGWLKSGVGRGVFFISLGLLAWSIGQLGWSYFLFADPTTETPPSHILDIIDFAAIPLWFVGIIMLSKATGARYALKRKSGQLLIVVVAITMSLLSYYFLVVEARGGTAYFDQAFWNQFFDLGYSIGDAIIATIAIVVFSLSWKLLGGRFKLPITVILLGFVLLFFADFAYSFRDGRGEYFNGDIADLLYMLTITAFGLGLSMLDPSPLRTAKPVQSSPQPVQQPLPTEGQELPQ